MNKNDKKEAKKCFIITPIGENNSETFRMANGVIQSVIKPVLYKYGYNDIKPSYEISQTGMINTQIINRILDDDLVIANLTGNNPNVMYELCLRHVSAKPIIHICQYGTSLPFDIKDNRTIFYKDDMMGVQELIEQLNKFLKEINYSKECIDNPIYTAKRMSKLLKEVPSDSKEGIEIAFLREILGVVNKLSVSSNDNEINSNDEFAQYFLQLNSKVSADLAHKIQDEICEELRKKCIYCDRGSLDNEGFSYYTNHGLSSKQFVKLINNIAQKYNVDIYINTNAHMREF